MTIVDQLVRIYLEEETWHEKKLDEASAKLYTARLLEKGNILYYEFNGEVLGYVEFWNINFEQLGRIICHEKFCADSEKTQNGNICYVANTWIHPLFRDGFVYKTLKERFFKANRRATYFLGVALRKKAQPVKVFRMTDMIRNKYKGDYHGSRKTNTANPTINAVHANA